MKSSTLAQATHSEVHKKQFKIHPGGPTQAQCGALGAVLTTTVQQTTGVQEPGGSNKLGKKKKRAEMPMPPVPTTSSQKAKAKTIGRDPPSEKGGNSAVTEKIENKN